MADLNQKPSALGIREHGAESCAVVAHLLSSVNIASNWSFGFAPQQACHFSHLRSDREYRPHLNSVLSRSEALPSFD